LAYSPSPEGPKNFLGEFFFPKTSSLLRKRCTRPVQETFRGWSRALAPLAPEVAPPSADAQAARAKPKSKAKKAGAPVKVTVTNSRKADLVQLQAAQPGSANWKKVLGPVKSGKQASAKLPQGADCRFDLHGTFADGQSMDASGVNVCADKTLNLTD
jgi:hypothetical protein